MKNVANRRIDKRYQVIGEIGKGGMGVVYKVTDRLNAQVVALKQVIPDKGEATPDGNDKQETGEIRLAIAHEFALLAGLRHPHIISVLDYGFDEQHQAYYTMQYLEDAQSIDKAVQNKPHYYTLELIRQMLEALRYLHQHDVIHHDVKPANALVVDDQLKLVDFGISMTTTQARIKQKDELITGTLAYMAPEVLRNIALPSVASDLYSVGMIAYELIRGEYPYQSNTVYSLIHDIAFTDLAFDELQATIAVRDFVKRLLEKKPEDRFQSASDAIKALDKATGHVTVTIDTQVRESLLQAARFIGRGAEFSRLENALNTMLKHQQGCFWLISGESGIGKSRLVDELRIIALVNGALVLNGQAVYEGGQMLGSWKQIVRRLLLSNDVSMEEVAILKQIVPDIASLLELTEDIPEPPLLPPEAAHKRLIETIVSLITREDQPLLIIVEDLQWATEGLEVLKAVKAIAPAHSMMVIGTYRNDERPRLPVELNADETDLIQLGALARSEIRQLVQAMLGDVDGIDRITDWLVSETEGNIFFIIEALRLILGDHGDISALETAEFPVDIMTSGIKDIINKRLSRVKESYRPLLKQIAVIGRRLDVNVLQYLIKQQSPDIDMQDWLSAGLEAAVLSVQEETWRFSHDKVRDGLLLSIEADDSQGLHRSAAQAFEAVYADDLSQHLATLIHLWREAGKYNKAVKYAITAAELASKAGLNQSAAAFLASALNALERLPQTPEIIRQTILVTLDYSKAGAFFALEDKHSRLLKALDLAEQIKDQELEARVMGALGTARYMSGKMPEAIGWLYKTIAAGEKLGLEDILVLPYNIIGRVTAVNGDYTASNDLLAKGIPLAEKYQDMDLQAGSLVYYGIGKEIIGQIGVGNPQIEQGLALSIATEKPERIASDHVILGMGYAVAMQFTKALIHCNEAIYQAKKINAIQTLGIAYGGLTIAYTWLGEDDQALEMLEKNDQIVNDLGMFIHYVWYRACKAEILRRRGQREEARKLAEELLQREAYQVLGLAETKVVLARIDMDEGNLESAENYLHQALESHQKYSCVALYQSARLDLARLRVLQGRIDEVPLLCDELASEFERLRMSRHLELLKDFRNTYL